MEYKKIKNLAGLMKEMGLSSLEYDDGETVLKMERAGALAGGAPPASAVAAPAPVPYLIDTHKTAEEDMDVAAAEGFLVKSPMVGVFYKAPGADKDPYVSAGDEVRAGDVLCIIEAMKIMNEITAERDGVIAEVYAENKQVVEFGQPLFRMTDREE